jgi:dihydroorotase
MEVEKGSRLIKSVVPTGFRQNVFEGETIDISLSSAGRIDGIGTDLSPSPGQAVVHGDGAYISPGWIDMHTHVYEAVRAGIEPDLIGPTTGVTRVVDAGSAGEASFPGFRKYVLDRSSYPIECFLNIGSFGISPYHLDGINLLRTFECATDNPEVIRGIKVLASKRFIGSGRVHPVAAAKRLAEDLGLPVMVHVAQPPIYIEEVVEMLGEGDIITHCFHGKIGNSIRSGKERVLRLYRLAQEKGIHLGVGHGAASFSFESAAIAIDQGVKPTVVSTDIHSGNYDGPVGSLAAVMSKMLACGMSLSEVIAGTTLTPATILRREEYGILETGARADLTIFALAEDDYTFYDAGAVDELTSGSDPRYQRSFHGEKAFRPIMAFWDECTREADDLDLTGGS